MSAFESFQALEIRVGTIQKAEINIKAKKPAYILEISFGEFGTKKSSAQITENYSCEELIGKQIIALINISAKKVANVISECLVLGVVGDISGVVLLRPDIKVMDGYKIS